MPDPMRIRAQVAGDKATVRVLMSHEMETGLRKDAAGKTIPAWYVQEVTAQLNGNIKGAKVGDKVSVTWKDNKGETRTDEAAVA
jgi:sulfur-oxidizing protein SoxZ